jgi:hypothetical protein
MRGRRSLDKFVGSLDKSERLIARGLEAMLLEVVCSVMYTIQISFTWMIASVKSRVRGEVFHAIRRSILYIDRFVTCYRRSQTKPKYFPCGGE